MYFYHGCAPDTCNMKIFLRMRTAHFGRPMRIEALSSGSHNSVHLTSSQVLCCDEEYGLGKHVHGQCLDDANFVFNQLSPCNTVTWTARIVSSCRENQFGKVTEDFNEMGRQGIETITFILFKCFQGMCYDGEDDGMSGRRVPANAIKLGLESDVFVQCRLIHLYGKCGLVRYWKGI
ncbi:hypothetical protein QQP08_004312 [Theobroma cacao]|nr:hypothetical protein QQP08_004312 [Theobroma cacao]